MSKYGTVIRSPVALDAGSYKNVPLAM